jgi:competence protein ComEC
VKTPDAVGFVVYYALLFGVLTGWLLVPNRRVWTAAAVGLLAVVAFFRWNNHRQDTRITVLPLNGGDSIYIDAPGRMNDLLVDCGNESAAQFVVTQFLHARGAGHLPQLVLTHGDLRHISGASNVLESFVVKKVFTSSFRFRSSAYQRFVDALDVSPERRQRVNRGGRFGSWTVLHPTADDRFPEADDNALVLRGEFHGVRVLLCSDLGRPGQRALLERETDLRADVVACGIPARGEPLIDDLLDAVQPRVIIVSASEVPAQERATKELRERLERRDIPVFYTSDDGAVTVILGSKSWEARTVSKSKTASGSN